MNAVEQPRVSGYPCPHCHRQLEAPDDRWQGWVLCPGCGLPGLPPSPPRRIRRRRREVPALVHAHPRDEDTIDQSAPAGGTRPNPAFPPRPARVSSAPRLIFTTGLFVSAFLLLIAYLERSTPNTVVFGCLTIVCFLVLLRLPRTR